MPTKRTGLKFLRGLAFAVVGTGLVFVDRNTKDLVDPTVYPFIVPIIAFGYRWYRGATGKEPGE